MWVSSLAICKIQTLGSRWYSTQQICTYLGFDHGIFPYDTSNCFRFQIFYRHKYGTKIVLAAFFSDVKYDMTCHAEKLENGAI